MTPRWARVDTATMASERPNPAISMPLEVVLHILDIVSYVERHLVDRDTLQSCSLVCRAWSFPAQDRLFREMYLHTPRASAAFTASMLSSPILSSSITSLHISIDLRQSGQISLGTFAAFVQSCPNVVHIDLAVYASRPVPSLDEHLFKLPRSSKISSLRLSNWTQSRELLPQLLEVWPTVRSLSLSGNAPTFSPGQSFVPCSFEDLRVNARPSPSVEFLQWLLPCSLSTLRKIELERTPSSETLSYITETYGATLTSLTLPSCGLRDHVYAVKSCNALEDFRIETPWSAPFLVAKVLPSTIRRIAFGINRDTVRYSSSSVLSI